MHTQLPKILRMYLPLHEGSDFFAHVIEHCCNQQFPMTPRTFFSTTLPLVCELHQGIWLEIMLPHTMSYQSVLRLLDQPLDPKLIAQELRVLRDELPNEKGTYDLVCDTLGKGRYPGYKRGKKHPSTIAALQAYHHRHVRKGRWMVTDIYERLIASALPLKKYAPDHTKKLSLTAQLLHTNNHDFRILSTPLTNLENYLCAHFLKSLCTYFELYAMRFKGATYHYDAGDENYYPKHYAVVLPRDNSYLRDEPFFAEAKTYYLHQLQTQYGKSVYRLRELLTNTRIDEKKADAFFAALTQQTCMNYLQG